jgi:hypothetical protein
MSNNDGFGSSGVSIQPSGFWKTSAIYDGMGYSFSTICSSVSRYCAGSFSRVRCATRSIRISKHGGPERRRRTRVLNVRPFLQLGGCDGALEERGQDAVHAGLVAWRAGRTRVAEGGGNKRDARRGSGGRERYCERHVWIRGSGSWERGKTQEFGSQSGN